MTLADAFRELLAAGRELVSDPAVKQAIADDIALLEQKAQEGISALEQHIAGWLAGHYALPAPQDAPAAPAAADVPRSGM